MNNTLHTPAPWKHDPTWGIIKHGKTEICALHSGNLANARLIASAPDLLDALQVCIDSFEEMIGISDFGSPTESDFPLKQAREALRKAKGEA
jgi:hypothetical protein